MDLLNPVNREGSVCKRKSSPNTFIKGPVGKSEKCMELEEENKENQCNVEVKCEEC